MDREILVRRDPLWRVDVLSSFTAAYSGRNRFVVPETGADSRRGRNFTAARLDPEPKTVDEQLQRCLERLDCADAAGGGAAARQEPKPIAQIPSASLPYGVTELSRVTKVLVNRAMMSFSVRRGGLAAENVSLERTRNKKEPSVRPQG